MSQEVFLREIAEKMDLKNLTAGIDLQEKKVFASDINRPGLQLAGFFESFDPKRVQVIGEEEFTFLKSLAQQRRKEICGKILGYPIPCIIFCRDLVPPSPFLDRAEESGVPVLSSEKNTCPFVAELTRWLNVRLAPRISVHGVLMDIYGVGVLIMGESGIGKSETALELIKRGHRLVADDIVEIRRVSDVTLVGSAPDLTKNFIELRGIGIVDVKSMFGVQSVMATQNIDLVVTFEEWDKNKKYDRIGLTEEHEEFLGIKVVCHHIPIRPGRNLAVICESAAANHRQKSYGYNAAEELYKRVQANIVKRKR